jgi:hypothetical protein
MGLAVQHLIRVTMVEFGRWLRHLQRWQKVVAKHAAAVFPYPEELGPVKFAVSSNHPEKY